MDEQQRNPKRVSRLQVGENVKRQRGGGHGSFSLFSGTRRGAPKGQRATRTLDPFVLGTRWRWHSSGVQGNVRDCPSGCERSQLRIFAYAGTSQQRSGQRTQRSRESG